MDIATQHFDADCVKGLWWRNSRRFFFGYEMRKRLVLQMLWYHLQTVGWWVARVAPRCLTFQFVKCMFTAFFPMSICSSVAVLDTVTGQDIVFSVKWSISDVGGSTLSFSSLRLHGLREHSTVPPATRAETSRLRYPDRALAPPLGIYCTALPIVSTCTYKDLESDTGIRGSSCFQLFQQVRPLVTNSSVISPIAAGVENKLTSIHHRIDLCPSLQAPK